MKVITEIDLRDMYRKEPFDSFTVIYPEKLTPSAFQFLNEKKIKIIEIKEEVSGGRVKKKENKLKVLKEPEKGYLLLDSGTVVEEKPEAYTHLKGKTLVPKNHKRIVLRGKLDKLEAHFVNVIIELQSTGFSELIKDLTTIFEYSKKIMRAEVLNEELPFIDFRGLSDKDIREQSHHPDKYFGVNHFVPDPKYGKVIAQINILRTLVRELEIAVVDAFYDEEKNSVEREDIIMALNRMSSLIYIVMCQYIGGIYRL